MEDTILLYFNNFIFKYKEVKLKYNSLKRINIPFYINLCFIAYILFYFNTVFEGVDFIINLFNISTFIIKTFISIVVIILFSILNFNIFYYISNLNNSKDKDLHHESTNSE